jgi:ubiquinone/menaquinone biosynthesis C-methylase UbiE
MKLTAIFRLYTVFEILRQFKTKFFINLVFCFDLFILSKHHLNQYHIIINYISFMENKTNKSITYTDPSFYEMAYPASSDVMFNMGQKIFERYLEKSPSSILDLGCGTGRELNFISTVCHDCVGVDYHEEMIRFAKSKYPHIAFQVGDIRSLRLNRTFDVVLCIGNVLTHAWTNEKLEQTLQTFAIHAKRGSLLILEFLNAAHYLSEITLKEETDLGFASNLKKGAINSYRFQRDKQLILMKYRWEIEGQAPIEEEHTYRLLFPAELTHLLSQKGFDVVGMFDNKQLEETDLSGKMLYVISVFRD